MRTTSAGDTKTRQGLAQSVTALLLVAILHGFVLLFFSPQGRLPSLARNTEKLVFLLDVSGCTHVHGSCVLASSGMFTVPVRGRLGGA